MELKTIKQNIKRQLGFDDPDSYLKVYNGQHGHCAMCREKHENYDLHPNTLRLHWELSLVCSACLHVLEALRSSDGLVAEYIRESMS